MSTTEKALTKQELLARAASCYQRSGLQQDAIRCYEGAGDFGGAALLYQQLDLWREAAECFRRDENWHDAARCALNAGLFSEAAEDYQRAGQNLEAAWVLAHRGDRKQHALAVIAGVTPEGVYEELFLGLIRGCCSVGRQRTEPAQAIRAVTQRLGETSPGPQCDKLIERSYELAHEVLDRPDLVAELFAASANAGWSEAFDRWERWAVERFGSAEGIPTAESWVQEGDKKS